jgi:hypothetical protein
MAVHSAAGLCIRTDMAYDEGRVVRRAKSFRRKLFDMVKVKVSAPRATTSPLNLGVSPIRVPPNPKSSKVCASETEDVTDPLVWRSVRLGFN